VLRSYPLRETSKIVCILGFEHGRLRLVAQGSRAARSRFGASLEPGNEIEIVYSLGPQRDLGTLREATLRRPWLAGTRALEPLAAGLATLELLERLVPEGAAEPSLGLETVAALAALRDSVGRAPALHIFYAFELRLLGRLGLRPALAACDSCGDAAGERSGCLDLEAGAFRCRRCGTSGPRPAAGRRRSRRPAGSAREARTRGSRRARIDAARAPPGRHLFASSDGRTPRALPLPALSLAAQKSGRRKWNRLRIRPRRGIPDAGAKAFLTPCPIGLIGSPSSNPTRRARGIGLPVLCGGHSNPEVPKRRPIAFPDEGGWEAVIRVGLLVSFEGPCFRDRNLPSVPHVSVCILGGNSMKRYLGISFVTFCSCLLLAGVVFAKPINQEMQQVAPDGNQGDLVGDVDGTLPVAGKVLQDTVWIADWSFDGASCNSTGWTKLDNRILNRRLELLGRRQPVRGNRRHRQQGRHSEPAHAVLARGH
jgi:DNA repair protein RecO (recombination protein O)